MRQDILEGLRRATSKGTGLQQAMMSFYYAGYSKEDIEEAAKALVQEQYSPNIPKSPQPIAPSKPIEQPRPIIPPVKPLSPVFSPQSIHQQIPNYPIQQNQTKQIVSDYSSTKKSSSIALVVILIIILLILIGVLVSILFFKDSLLSYFSKIFGI